jgi:membrane associated rhomboid family serine protease
MSIWEEIKQSFRHGSTLTRLIYINLAVFVILKLVTVIFFLSGHPEVSSPLRSWLAVPADVKVLVFKPWTLLTYMFLHYGFLHVLFNMLWLYWFGQIMLIYFTQKQLLNIYILGGLCGASFYILAYNIFPVFHSVTSVATLEGASASMVAIGIAIAAYAPNYTLNLLLISQIFGPIKLKYIALFMILSDLLFLDSGNAGGHIAHLGGALFGMLYAVQFKKGKSIDKGFGRLMDWLFSIFKPRPKFKVSYKNPVGRTETDMEYRQRKATEQAEIDRILDKIATSGYEKLSQKEKETLFKASEKK